MKSYDKNKPLIVIHIPKTAGVSFKEIFKDWFGDNLLYHYCKWEKGKLPEKHDLSKNCSKENSLVVFGHFNRVRKFGIEQYYPNVDQFITILRDPLEQAISGYFYVRETNPNWREILQLSDGGVNEYIDGLQSGVLDYFPHEVTAENFKEMFKEKFIEVGVTEHLDESFERISKKLGKNYTRGSLGNLNSAKRDQHVNESVKKRFKERHQLDYIVYNYVLDKYK